MEASSRAQSVYALAQSWAECAPVSETCTRAAAAVAGGASRKALPPQARAAMRPGARSPRARSATLTRLSHV